MKERPAKICALAREGHSIPQIMRICGVTQNAVRTTLRRYGIEWIKTKRGPKDVSLIALNDGLSLRNRAGKHYLYNHQKNAAKRRGIGWEITFAEWIGVWMSSGHWEKRGRGADCYCMARHGDAGPYAVGNVSIKLFGDNIREARQIDWARRKQRKAEAAQGGVMGADPRGESAGVVHSSSICPPMPINANQLCREPL